MSEEKTYETIKENRGWYFVEYKPPRMGSKYAYLNLIVLVETSKDQIAETMEKELGDWVIRYPIPIFVTAFDIKGDVVNLSNIRPINHLLGFFDRKKQISIYWSLLKDNEIPNDALNQKNVDKIYSNLKFKTRSVFENETKEYRRNIRIGWFIVFIWFVIIPISIEFLEYYSNLLAIIALIYSLYQAVKKGLELTGKWPKSKKQIEKEKEKQLKDHYYYHCQKNPEGFRRIMIENLEMMEKEKILKEAESIKQKQVG